MNEKLNEISINIEDINQLINSIIKLSNFIIEDSKNIEKELKALKINI